MEPSQLLDHWQRIEEVFYTALELDPESRPAFLQQVCGANLELQREVESLLDSSQKTVGKYVREAVLRVARQQTTGLQPSGKRVGAYQLLTVIGEGGMGSVYLATRADESYHQQVAIKLMHPGFGPSQGVLVRFSAERQILASLNHPNIARLLDGGMTTDGMPYLVMEYVEGVAIDEYCRQNALSIDGRLQLFRTVCAAVEYAHKHLVVHRDIKPANILVTSEGVPKLLDFGIAKLLDPQAGSAALTRTGERLMTPEYATPEQILGNPITTATDVYALGVLLFELLVGERPFDLRMKRPLEIAQIISEQDPEPPSKMVGKSPGGHATDATRKLKGDLDHIVLMAMRKEPSRRYTSVAAFSADVHAYLTGFSVQAHTDTWRYRGGKFVRRHKVAVPMAILSLVALIGFGVGLALLAKRADQQRLAAQREAEFLGSIFDAATPQTAKGNTITARQLLDQGAKRIDGELAATPDVQATALFNLGTAYRQLGATEQAEALLQRAYELRRKLYGEGNLDVADTASALAEVYRLEAQYAKAELLYRQALAAAQEAPGENTRIVSEIFARLGFCLYLDSQDAEAESALRKSLTLSPKDTYAAFRQSELALVLDRKGDITGAWQIGTLAIDTLERHEGPNSPNLIGARNNLNEVLRDSGNLKEAEKVEREILALWRRIAGNHVDVAWGLNNLGVIFLAEGNWKEAQSVLWEALSVRQEQLGGNNSLVAASLLNCGRVLQAKGDYPGAEKYFRQSLDMLRETIGPQNWSVESALKSFALLQLDRGDYAGAEPYAEQALEMSRKLGGDINPEVATILTITGVGRELRGDVAGAEPLLRSALEIRKALFSPGHPAIVSAETRLGEALTSEGELQLAEPILREAVNTAHTAPFPLLPWQVAEPEHALGICLGELGHAAEAESLLRNSRTSLTSYPVPALRRLMLERRERP